MMALVSPANAKGRLVRILAIDGGGMRGIIPARLLAHLEERTGRRAAELFDLVAGTSTGGLLALGLSKPDPHHPARPHYRASEIVDFYRLSGRDIFRRSLLHFIRSLGSWLGPKYPPAGLERTPKSLVDGGLFASNPAMSGLAEALRIHGCEGRPEARDFVVVSLGTGYNPRPESYATLRSRGRLGWAVPILDMVFDGASGSVDYQVGKLIGARYFRFQEEGVAAEMDDASDSTLDGLVRVAEAIIAREEERLDELARVLVSGAAGSVA
jgi:hypothetical protein